MQPMRPCVLVTDDVEANLRSVQALLADLDCEVVLARSGNETLRHLLKREFAVILLDVQMPEMDGYEVAQHVRSHPRTREVPIIFATATHGAEHDVLRGYGSGAVDFLMKPINPEVLRSKVRVFLELYSSRRAIANAKAELEDKNQALDVAYRTLQSTQSQLVQSAKMASLGELVAGVAHEINNPLAFAISHLNTALRSIASLDVDALHEPQRSSVQRACNRLQEMGVGLDRIRELVSKLKTFSRLEEGELKTISVRDSVDAVLTILSHRLEDRIEVTTRFAAQDVIRCYAAALNQAIMNLVSNAIDAIEGRGSISVTTHCDGAEYRIEISDTGCGIPEAIRERVCDPFFTTKPVGAGTGLGLSITYTIVKSHGGELQLLPREGGGTTAVVRLPLPEADAH